MTLPNKIAHEIADEITQGLKGVSVNATLKHKRILNMLLHLLCKKYGKAHIYFLN